MHSQTLNLEDEASSTLDRYSVVDKGHIFLVHHTAEILNFAKHSSKTDFLLLQSASINPDLTNDLVAFHANETKGHICPSRIGFCRIMGNFQLSIIYVERELRVKLVSTDARSWTLSFAGADVETA